jgi:hypothetical protein
VSGSNNQYIITLDKGNYTPGDLATELKTKMNTATQSLATNIFDCTYDFKSNRLLITAVEGSTLSSTFGFYILTPKDLQTRMNGVFSLQYNIKNPMDCNEIIGNFEGYSSFVGKNAVWSGGQVNLQPIRNIYMHSSALGNLSNIGPDGSQTVIKKIPVTSSFNNYIFDQTVMFNDYNSCSGQTLKKLDFQFKTARGEIIPLSGLNVSFSIVFSRAHPDA